MPDYEFKTVSATQAAALFDESPYETRYTLYRWLSGHGIEVEENERMRFGKVMQPILLDESARDWALEIKANDEDKYVRRGPLGATVDAWIRSPDQGPGILEVKCVWDYSVWMQMWTGGSPPRHIELQHQVQMYVGDGETPYEWGLIGALVCGEMKYWKRQPDPKLWEMIEAEAATMLAAVKTGRQPSATGAPVENDYLVAQYPELEDKIVDNDDPELAEDARMWAWARKERLSMEKVEKALRPKLLDAVGDGDKLRLPGSQVKFSRSTTPARTVNVKAGTRTNMSIHLYDDEETTPPAEFTA